jgi:hypothetical protein
MIFGVQKFHELLLMTLDTALVAYHLRLLAFGGFVHSLSMAFKAIFEPQCLMHFDHLGILAMAAIASQGFSVEWSKPCCDQQH